MSLSDEECPGDVDLNSDPLFADGNFKSCHPNERGRGAFAAALFSLLVRYKVAKGHIHVLRGTNTDRWLLNRMPGRTHTCLRFVNRLFVAMLGMQPFPSWRNVARSLGDSRAYLPARHWTCLELKGGGANASATQPWQAYQATSGHFDRLADDLVDFLVGPPPPAAPPPDSAKAASGGRRKYRKRGQKSSEDKSKKQLFSKNRLDVLDQTQRAGKTVHLSFATVELLQAALTQHWEESIAEDSTGATAAGGKATQEKTDAKKRNTSKPVAAAASDRSERSTSVFPAAVMGADAPFAPPPIAAASSGFHAIVHPIILKTWSKNGV